MADSMAVTDDNNIVYVGFETDQVNQSLVAKPYDNTRTYHKGELIIENGELLECQIEMEQPESYVAAHWKATDISSWGYGAGSMKIVRNNPEYLYAITDANGVFLFGIKRDASIEWAKGIPTPLAEEIAKKVTTEVGKGLIDAKAASVVTSLDSEYSFAVKSADNSLLYTLPMKAMPAKMFDNVSEMLADRSYKGEYVRTLGYNVPYDGGGLIYRLYESIPPGVNSSDALVTGSNKFAIPMLDVEFTPEQFGCFGKSTESLSTAISRGFRLGGRVCKLGAKCYYTNGIIFVREGCSIIGTAIAGTPHTTIAVNGTYQGHPYGINVNERSATIKNVAILNNTSDTSEGAGIYNSGWESSYNKYNLHIDNVIVYGFSNGFRFSGEGKWCYDIRNARLQSCHYGVYCNGGFCIKFESVYTDHCYAGFALYNETNAVFSNCNIGIATRGVVLASEGNGSTHNYSTLKFISCNFEYDEIVSNIDGGCIFVASNAGGNICLDSCRFFFNTSYVDNTTTHVKLGPKCSITLLDNVAEGYIQGDFFDPTSPPEQRVGSVQFIGRNRNIAYPNFANDHRPSVLMAERNMIPIVVDINTFTSDYSDYNGIFVHNGAYKIKSGNNIIVIETRQI